MMSHGYKPQWSEGAIKPPIFQSSTFVFESAEQGKAYFEWAYGLKEMSVNDQMGLIYSRINNPNLEILEDRLTFWDKAEDSAVFASGMAAISTVLLEFLNPGDLLLYSTPTYGGTDHFIKDHLDKIGVHCLGFSADDSEEDIIDRVERSGHRSKLAFVYIETPSNPTNRLIDIKMCRFIADHFSSTEKGVLVGVDNTYMGPIWSQPVSHGADLVIYSATKYLGGHSDLIAGAVLGTHGLIARLKNLRTFLGNVPTPHTCWLLTRSLETLKVRMDQQMNNARILADRICDFELVEKVNYFDQLRPGHKDYEVYKRQYSSPGAMISFVIKGGERAAFQFLNNLEVFQLAVSLGSTESLAQHPYSMTHAGVDCTLKEKLGIHQGLVRLSVGIENIQDLIDDIEHAMKTVKMMDSPAVVSVSNV